MKLSQRLQTVANMVSKNRIIADVGTDHGYVPIYLIEQKIINKAYALDISQGSVQKTQDNIDAHGLGDRIIARCSDGFANLEADLVDGAVMAGMGGDLIVNILSACTYLEQLDELVLSPQKHPDYVRKFLVEHNYAIVDEKFLFEDGKYYTVMKAVRPKEADKEAFTEAEYMYGKLLLARKDEELKKFLDDEKTKYTNIKKQMDRADESLDAKIDLIEKGLDYYE